MVKKINAITTATPASGDKLLGTDVSDTGTDAAGATKNFTVAALLAHVEAEATAFATAEQGGLAASAVQPGDLGTAAAEDVEAFATAAQGELADTAVQPGDLGTAAAEDVGAFATAEQGGKADTALQAADITGKAPLESPAFTGTVTLPVGLTGVLRADAGVVSTDSDVTDLVSAASEGAAGKVELATSGEAAAGSDTARAVTPAGLAATLAPSYVTLTASRDTAGTDNGKDIESTASSGITLTVQADTVPRGLILTQMGTGQVTVAAGAGVTLRRESVYEARTARQYAVVALLPTSTANTFRLAGGLELSE